MSLWDDLKKKAYDANPELAAKAAQALEKARDLAVEAGQKAAPIIKEASDKAAGYAQEKTPVLKAQALKAIDDARQRRAKLQEQARQDKAARAEMIRTMYDVTLTPEDVNFIEEPFNHFERQLMFFVRNGEVLESEKRNQTHMDAYHSHQAGSGTLWKGTGTIAGSSSTLQVSARNVQEHEFWVRLENGTEACFQLNNNDVRIRPGQHVSMAFLRNANQDMGQMVALYNHNAGQNYVTLSPKGINQQFQLYLKEPGIFNANEVNGTRDRLLQALGKRMDQLARYMALHGDRRGGQVIDVQPE
ncbi:TPA: hypothetical protein U8251_002709 [Pseudomonas putida]|nr:hypothetical protein [Pseudomonas putida]